MKPRSIFPLILAVNLAAMAGFVLFTDPIDPRKTGYLLALVLLGALLGARPVRLPGLRLEMMPTHPLILVAVASVGIRAAALVALTAVVGAAVGRQGRPLPVRFSFNAGSMVLTALAAGWAFASFGGRVGQEPLQTVFPLVMATATYFAVNSLLVATAVAMEKNKGLVTAWIESLGWTTASYFAGFTIAVGLLLVLRSIDAFALVLAIPPSWLLIAFYRSHRERIKEKQRRIGEVERLNGRLSQTVAELEQALSHVKQLQGLIPVCLHCKSVRDDDESWTKIETYLADHSVEITLDLCDGCRTEQFPILEDRPAPRHTRKTRNLG